jgi:hypothetical protein
VARMVRDKLDVHATSHSLLSMSSLQEPRAVFAWHKKRLEQLLLLYACDQVLRGQIETSLGTRLLAHNAMKP